MHAYKLKVIFLNTNYIKTESQIVKKIERQIIKKLKFNYKINVNQKKNIETQIIKK